MKNHKVKIFCFRFSAVEIACGMFQEIMNRMLGSVGSTILLVSNRFHVGHFNWEYLSTTSARCDPKSHVAHFLQRKHVYVSTWFSFPSVTNNVLIQGYMLTKQIHCRLPVVAAPVTFLTFEVRHVFP